MSAPAPTPGASRRVLRIAETLDKSGLCRSSVYKLMAQGEFPRPIKLGSTKAVGWLESDIEDWIDQQVEAARKADEADTPEPVPQDSPLAAMMTPAPEGGE